jgi:exodeoxyribonuclease VII large subunit
MQGMAESWSVSDLNRYVRDSLEKDFRLKDLRVRGEVSGFRAYPSGHWYFTLKDDRAQVSCVMWRNRAERQRVAPRDGDAVEAIGSVTLYEARGQYQLDVLRLAPAGRGELYLEFEKLKERLQAEGLFDRPRRPLPERPRVIGIVTSPVGAALQDMLNILRRRYPLAEVIISPTLVQGGDAPPLIVAALERLAALRPDVILLARGGGSIEDLWAFNDERLARALARMPVPVVSGVGHETDFTIADFVSDLRAPTPSAAAELVTPIQVRDLRDDLDAMTARMAAALLAGIRARRASLLEAQAGLRGLSPRAQLASARQRLVDARYRLSASMWHRLRLERERASRLAQALQAVSPLAVLERGYAMITRPAGGLVRRAAEVLPGEPLRVQMSDGQFGVLAEGPGTPGLAEPPRGRGAKP